MPAILRVLEKGYLNLYQQQLDMGLLEMNNGCQYNRHRRLWLHT